MITFEDCALIHGLGADVVPKPRIAARLGTLRTTVVKKVASEAAAEVCADGGDVVRAVRGQGVGAARRATRSCRATVIAEAGWLDALDHVVPG